MEHQRPPPKRRKLDPGHNPQQHSHHDYTIGWVCALAIEAAAATAMLDEIHPALPIHPRDSNSYTLGSIGRHNIVIACLPAGVYGTTSAATVASNMFISFRSIRHLLMVGVGGGAPSASTDIRLGDVVVSIPTPRFEGVVQYDYGKTIGQGHFERTGTLNKPSTSLLTAVSNLRAADLRSGSQIPALMSQMLARNPQMAETFTSPGCQRDLLFASDYEYDPAGPTCGFCDREKLVSRSTRSSDRPVVHYGLIASGNQVIKHAPTRDRLTAELNILCFEMEAAGLMDNFPCLVIRGVSDYSDSHKNKDWQGYAAATAAAYAKQLLATIGACGPGPIPNPAVPGAITAVQHRASMIDALRFDQLESRQATIKPAHAKTCKWLLEKQEYVDWLDSNHFPEHRGFLWIKGKAGSGKSTMMKFAFLQADATMDADTKVVSFFFNARGEDLEKSTLGMYRSLLVQLLEKLPELQALLDELDPKRWDEKYPWCHEIFQHILRKSISLLSGRRVICFVDALDECEEEEVRTMVDFIQSLGEHAISSSVQFHVCFSSRHYPHIAIDNGLELILEDQEGHADDITRYLRSELKIGRSKQAEDIRCEIQAKASGIFLWMVLVVQILNREFQRGRLHALRNRLREIPAKLSDLFKDILTRDTVNMEDLLLSIQWILFARRPLKREELYFAILSADPDNLAEAWDPEDITEQDIDRFILSTSKGLAETTKSKAKTVQFIHESVRDFLLKENGLRQLWPEHQGNFEASSHNRLKQCCNNTLLAKASNHIADEESIATASKDELKALWDSVSRRVPFLEYAVHNVLQHSEAAERGGIRQGCFLGNFNFPRWKHCSNAFERYKSRRHTQSECLLHIVAKYDLSNLFRLICKDKPCGYIPSRRDLDFLVFYAVRSDIMEFLDIINQNQLQVVTASPNACIEMALRCTIKFDRQAMFTNLLTNNSVDLNLPDKDGKQCLHYVIQYGRDFMFNRILTMREIDLNAPDRDGDTPLHYTIQFDQNGMFSKLLTADNIASSVKNKSGQTPVHYAVKYRRETMFNLLITRHRVDLTTSSFDAIEHNKSNRVSNFQSVSANRLEKGDKEPLTLAFDRVNDTMTNPNLNISRMNHRQGALSDEDWNSMLQYAAVTRWSKGVEPLIAMDGSFPSLTRSCAEAVLLYAAWIGYKALVDKVLATGKADPNTKFIVDGMTALAYAASGGYTEIARHLLSTEGIDVDAKNLQGATPLAHAASHGHTAIVNMLLSTGNVDPGSKDLSGYTALSRAVVNGHRDVVRQLLATGRVKVFSYSGNKMRWRWESRTE